MPTWTKMIPYLGSRTSKILHYPEAHTYMCIAHIWSRYAPPPGDFQPFCKPMFLAPHHCLEEDDSGSSQEYPKRMELQLWALFYLYHRTPPYGHLIVKASLFCPGKTRKHFLIRKHINLATVLIWWMATFWNHNLYTNILFSTFNTSFWTNYVHLSISYIILHVLTEVFFINYTCTSNAQLFRNTIAMSVKTSLKMYRYRPLK